MERERFISINGRFLSSHVLKETDFEMAENYIAAIEHNHERCKTPQAGDVVEGAYYDGKFPYSNGIIEKIHEDGSLSICYQPYIPFIWLKKRWIHRNECQRRAVRQPQDRRTCSGRRE